MNDGAARTGGEVFLVDIEELKEHEKTSAVRVALVLASLVMKGAFTTPLLVDAASMTILDGHHRYAAARILGLERVPCWCVDYFDDASVALAPRRQAIAVSKEEVVRRGMAGDLYPRKTTRHAYEVPPAPLFTLRELRRKKK